MGIFKANNPFNPFILFIYGLLLKLAWFINPQLPETQKTDGFFFREILEGLQPFGAKAPIIYPVIIYTLLFTQAVTFNKLINEQKLMQRPNYLPAMSYLLVTSLFGEWNVLSASLVINTLLIWAWAKMSNLYTNTNSKATIFNIGIMIGVSTFFYLPSLAFTLLIIFALIVARPFILAEWIIAVLGIVTPYYFLFAYLFLSDKLNNYKLPQFEISYPYLHGNRWEWVAISIVLLSFLTGAFFVRANFRRQLVQVRKRWSLILLYLLVAVFVPFINATHTFEYWILTAVPLSAYIGCAFLYPSKKWLPLILHWSMVFLVIIISYKI